MGRPSLVELKARAGEFFSEWAAEPNEAEIALATAQAENEQLRQRVHNLEGALRCAAKVLAPYR